MGDCLFCKIVKGEVPAKIVYRDEEVVAFYDIHQVAPVHVLVIPVKHIESLAKAAENDLLTLGKIQVIISRLAKELKIADGFRVLVANGKKGGQSVFHLHYHLIGGWKDEAPRMETR